MHRAFMVMGVSGCGKSTVGAAFARAIGGRFLDGDDYHPQSNVDHMAAGHPLTDEMRWPWLELLSNAVNTAREDADTVFACSALRRSYRNFLRQRIPELKVIYLDAPREVVSTRLSARSDHFMPASLLDSQFATLEVPAMTIATLPIDQSVDDMVAQLGRLV
jgi:carbohydrate kinase (thermoresistant glucokinase family)